MGWERKRGKLHEFNRLLRGADRHQLRRAARRSRRCCRRSATSSRSIPTPSCRSRPAAAAGRHAVAPAEPAALRPARAARDRGLRHSPAARRGQRRQREPHARSRGSFPVTSASIPYTTAVSDVYQDLFHEGSYVGKGIYDVDAFESGARRIACRRTRCSATTSSRGRSRARRCAPTSTSSTTTRPTT